jgi:hypothetical protein
MFRGSCNALAAPEFHTIDGVFFAKLEISNARKICSIFCDQDAARHQSAMPP